MGGGNIDNQGRQYNMNQQGEGGGFSRSSTPQMLSKTTSAASLSSQGSGSFKESMGPGSGSSPNANGNSSSAGASDTRVHGTIEEYLRIHDVGEVLSSMEELPRSAAGVLVLKIIARSLDTTRKDIQADLLRLCVDVAR